MQSYVNATLKIFVVALVGFVALSGCAKELSEIIGENHPLIKPGNIRRDSLGFPSDSIPTDTIITLPDTIAFPFPHDTIPTDSIPTDSIPRDTIFYPPVDTLHYEPVPVDSTLQDSTNRF